MSRIKLVLLVLVLLVLGATGGAFFHITRPSVQRGLLLEALADAGIPAEAGSVSISPAGTVKIEHLALNLPDLRLECREGAATVALTALLSHRLEITGLDLAGVVADFTVKTPPLPKKKKPDSGSAGKPLTISLRGERIEGLVVFPDRRRAPLAFTNIALGNTGSCSLSFETAAGAGAPAALASLGKISGSIKLRWVSPAPLAKVPASILAVLALRPAVELSIEQRSPAGTRSNLEITADTGANTLKWWLKAAGKNSSMQSTGAHNPDGSVKADFKFADFSSSEFPFAELAPQWTPAALPEITALNGTVTIARAGPAAPFEAAVNIKGAELANLGRFYPSLANAGKFRARLDGSATFATSRDWSVKIPGFHLASGKTGAPALAAAANINARAGRVTFGASAIAHAAGLAEQPAWSGILGPLAPERWRITLAASGEHRAEKTPEAIPRIILNTLSLSASPAATAGTAQPPAFTAKLLRPLDTAGGARDGVADFSVNAVRFPLELTAPFIGGAEMRGLATGGLTLSRLPGRLIASTRGRPLDLRSLSFTDTAGNPRLRTLDIAGNASFSIAEDASAWNLDLDHCAAGAAKSAGDGTARLAGSLALAWDAAGPASLRANLAGDPAPLLHQPLLGSFPNLESAALQLRAEYNRAGRVTLNLALDNIIGRNAAAGAPPLRCTISNAAGNLAIPTLQLPLRLATQGRVSDLTLNVQPATAAATAPATAAASPRRWKATLNCSLVDAGDAALLARIFSTADASDTGAGTAGDAPAAPDTAPFWAPLGEGALTVNITRILVPAGDAPGPATPLAFPPSAAPAGDEPRFEADIGSGTAGDPTALPDLPSLPAAGNTAAPAAPAHRQTPPSRPAPQQSARRLALAASSATATVAKDSLALNTLSIGLPASRLLGDGQITFAAGAGYRFRAKAAVKDFPLRQYVAFFKPDARDTLTGKFDISATAAGDAPNAAAIPGSANIALDAKSAGGRARVFHYDSKALSVAGGAAGIAGEAAGLASSVLGGGRSTSALRAFQKLQRYLDDFPYDSAALRVTRAPAGPWRVETLRVSNREIILAGSGVFAPAPGKPASEARLDITAGFAAKGDIADALRQLRLAGETAPDGFTAGPQFTFAGTPADIENNLLIKLLEAAKKAVDTLPDAAADALQEGAGLLRGIGF